WICFPQVRCVCPFLSTSSACFLLAVICSLLASFRLLILVHRKNVPIRHLSSKTPSPLSMHYHQGFSTIHGKENRNAGHVVQNRSYRSPRRCRYGWGKHRLSCPACKNSRLVSSHPSRRSCRPRMESPS